MAPGGGKVGVERGVWKEGWKWGVWKGEVGMRFILPDKTPSILE